MSTSKAVSSSASLQELVERQRSIVQVLGEVSCRINTSLDLEAIFTSTFELLDAHFGFQHVMILLVDRNAQEESLCVFASHGYDGAGLGVVVPFGRGIVGMVAKNRRLMRTSNMLQNRRYARAMNAAGDTAVLPGIPNCKSKLAVPLLVRDELVGVLAVESTNLAIYDDGDEELLQLMSTQIAIAINNADQFQKIETANTQLVELNENLESKVKERTRDLARQKYHIERQHSALTQQHEALTTEQQRTQQMLHKIETLFGQQVSQNIVSELVNTEGELSAKTYEVTVMFLDIRNFSAFADVTPAVEVATFQNIIFGEILQIVRKHGGITTQILGDGIMAVFGAPVVMADHASRAVQAGYAILDRVRQLGEEGLIDPVRLGMGLHSGDVIAGNIGNAYRKQYSLTGTTVITAARIEPLNKRFNSQFLVSGQTLKAAQLAAGDTYNAGEISLKGLGEKVAVYQLA